MGDRSSFVGRALRYSIRTDADSFPNGRLVELYGDSGQIISADVGVPPVNVWVERRVDLAEGSWFVGPTGGGTLATAGQIAGVLGDLERMLVGMEFGGDSGEEVVDLDSVALGICRIDFAAPWGVLSQTDVAVFVDLFFGADPFVAALAAPDDVVSQADVAAFVDLFFAGCP